MSILIQETRTLNNGVKMPVMGIGVFKVDNDTAEEVVYQGIQAGIRSIDTAAAYKNEQGVGDGISRAGVPREELFITTKLWNGDHGYDETLRACDNSLKLLRTDYVDLYLIHWPIPSLDRYVESWKAMERILEMGKARAIGVSNFNIPHLERLQAECEIVPAVNQIEIHPFLTQEPLISWCQQRGIVVEAWSPLAKNQVLTEPAVLAIAEAHGRQPAQVILRWHYQKGIVTIPKSVHIERIIANTRIFDFTLSADEMQQLDSLNRNYRTGPDPETFGRI